MTVVLLINPNTSARATEAMLAQAGPMLPPGCVVRGTQAARGAALIMDTDMLAIAEEEVVRLGTGLGPDIGAVIVGAFASPGAARLRAALDIPVIGIGEAALREAAAGGRRFGIVTPTPRLLPRLEACVRSLELEQGFTGIRVPRQDPLVMALDEETRDAGLTEAAALCVRQDGAEAVVIGHFQAASLAARLRRTLGVVVTDPMAAAVREVVWAVAPPPPRIGHHA